ncbi:MAG: peptide chain release factor N(5)-glutamine methyltransferase [Betaproteobacteria bacterium]|nr:peptide chain release factor N(5)-glutamine methyltransferase [Betaproteobacteria bacterium]
MECASRIGAAWRDASRHIDRLDARLLLEHVAGYGHVDLIARPELPLTAEQAARFGALVARRAGGEPLAYLTGSADFLGLCFLVSPAVLIPRPDTEVLVGVAKEMAAKRETPRIVDLGTGSGIVAVSLARFCPAANLAAADISPEALAVARANARRHGVQIRFFAGDWYSPLGRERFDIIVSNPPYVASGDPHLLQNGLPFEPRRALTDGVTGGDGLACIRQIVAGARPHLLPGGWLLVEHGYDQAARVRELLGVQGFSEVGSWRDLAAIERVSGGRLP